MAKIGLSSGFSLIPEGTHVFQITAVNYKEAFGKLEINMQTQDGLKHTERYSLLKSDGSTNAGALKAFSYFAKTALQDDDRSEVDPEELVGRFIECDVEHEVVQKKDGKEGETSTFARLLEKRPSDGWETAQVSATPTGGFDLAALLGNK